MIDLWQVLLILNILQNTGENRGILGGDAVGEETKSVTTHVFFVNQAVKTQFEAALTAAGITPLAPTEDAAEVDAAIKVNQVAADLTAFKAEVEKLMLKKLVNNFNN